MTENNSHQHWFCSHWGLTSYISAKNKAQQHQVIGLACKAIPTALSPVR